MVEAPGQAEVDDLDQVAALGDAQDVLRLEVKVKDALAVHVGDPAADLAHEVHAVTLRQAEVVAADTLKQLASADTGTQNEGMEE